VGKQGEKCCPKGHSNVEDMSYPAQDQYIRLRGDYITRPLCVAAYMAVISINKQHHMHLMLRLGKHISATQKPVRPIEGIRSKTRKAPPENHRAPRACCVVR
jgi:hypothetical protein